MARKTVTDDFKIFSDRLSKLMKERNVTQEQLAHELGVKRQTVSLYKNGQSTPDAAQLKNIAMFFGVSADWLLGLSSEDVWTTDVDIREICKYTGLSEKSVSYLLAISKYDNYPDESTVTVQTLNDLLGNAQITILLNKVAILKSTNRMSKKILDILDDINSLMSDNSDGLPAAIDEILYECGGKSLFDIEKNERFERFEVLSEFKRIIDELYPPISFDVYYFVKEAKKEDLERAENYFRNKGEYEFTEFIDETLNG